MDKLSDQFYFSRLALRLSLSCYFRKISRKERLSLADQIADAGREGAKEKYREARREIKSNYRIDCFKIVMLVLILLGLSAVIVLAAAILPTMISRGDLLAGKEVEYVISNEANQVLLKIAYVIVPTVIAVVFCLGLIFGKIDLREYKYHWIALALYVIVLALYIVILVAYIFYLMQDVLRDPGWRS